VTAAVKAFRRIPSRCSPPDGAFRTPLRSPAT